MVSHERVGLRRRHRGIPLALAPREGAVSLGDDSYRGVTDPVLLNWLRTFRGVFQNAAETVYVADLLYTIADEGKLGEFSQERFNLTHYLRREFVKSGIVSERKEEQSKKRHSVDYTGADILLGLAFEHENAGYGEVHIEKFVESLYQKVKGNRRLSEPLERFRERRKEKEARRET